MSNRLLILGSGGHGKSVAEAALLSGEWNEIIFLDDAWSSSDKALGWPVAGKINDIGQWAGQCRGAIAAVGNNSVRQRWSDAIEQAGSCCGYNVVVEAGSIYGPGTALC